MLRSVANWCRQLAARPPTGWYPLLAVQYLTYACDFACPYCSDGEGNPYPRLQSPILPASTMLELLRRIRGHCDFLVLTGGEPLLYPDVDEVLAGLPGLGFDGVVFTTNGHDLHEHLDAVAASVTYLVVSLETLDHEKADRIFGRGPGTLARILDNLERAASRPGRGYEIIVSAVATPEVLDDLPAVYAWSVARGFRFALCPQLVGVKAHPDLAGNPAYRRIYDLLIEGKRRGEPVNGTVAYLQHMRDLTKFDCRASTVLAVDPQGHVFYPCLERGRTAGSLLDHDLHELRRMGRRDHGPEPVCDNRCHSACALSLSLSLNRPWTMLPEVWHQGREALWRWRRGL